MSRRARAVKRPILPDPVFGSETVTKFVNSLMEDGKKSVAERIFYDAMSAIEERTGQPGENVFRQALSNAKPVLEVKSRRVGGATYQVPVEVRPERRQALGMRWLIQYARARGEKTSRTTNAMTSTRSAGHTVLTLTASGPRRVKPLPLNTIARHSAAVAATPARMYTTGISFGEGAAVRPARFHAADRLPASPAPARNSAAKVGNSSPSGFE